MGIYIPNVEMPREKSLWLCIRTDGTVYNIKPVGIGTAHAVGTAVPLPEGHGRLGDLDALQKEFKKSHDGKRLMIIDTAPTIVPAEGGADNG